MKKLLIYFILCISVFSDESPKNISVSGQRNKDLIYENVKINYEYSKREDKLNYMMLNYIFDYGYRFMSSEENYDVRIFEFFLSKGLNINSTEPDFLKELLMVTNNTEIYEYLIKKGLKYDRVMNNSPSILAPFIWNKYPEEYILKLIENGAKINESFEYENSEIIRAIVNGYSDKLLKKLLDMTQDKTLIAYTTIQYMSYNPQEEERNYVKQILKYLVKEGVKLNDAELFMEILQKECEDEEIYEILFQGGLNFKEKENEKTLLLSAIYSGSLKVTELLLKKGANPNIFEDKNVLMGYCANDEMYELFLKYGANKENIGRGEEE